MTTKTVTPAKVTTAVEPSYTELLRRARSLFARDVETRFELALIFSKMLDHKTPAEVAEDTDMTPGGVARVAQVADFWGNIRIKADGAGKRPAPWFIYDRVALDPVITDQDRQRIKQAAPKGLSMVRELIAQARQVQTERLQKIVDGDRPPRATAPRGSGRKRVAGKKVDAVGIGELSTTVPVDEVDGNQYVERALVAIGDAIENLDRLESLSDDDVTVVRVKIDELIKQLVRLRG